MNPITEDMTAKKPKTPATQSPRVMDIARPGTLKNATAGSRPVIVTNRVVIQDPMVKPAARDTDGDSEKAKKKDELTPAPARPKLVIQPLSDDDKDVADAKKEGLLSIPIDPAVSGELEEESSEAAEDALAAIESEADKPKTDDAVEAAPESTSKPEKKIGEKTAKQADEPIIDEAAEQSEDATESNELTDVTKVSAKAEAEAKAQEEIDELTENKTYFLPIESAEHRRSRIVAIVGFVLIVLLVLAWLDVALDAGFVEIPGVQPVTHFFDSSL